VDELQKYLRCPYGTPAERRETDAHWNAVRELENPDELQVILATYWLLLKETREKACK